jgi:ATP-dependent protease HslVU (ClpYQ) peptidase subunit
MSIIAAIKKNGKVYIGADTQTTSSKRKINYLNEENRKIRLLDNGVIIASAGRKAAGKLIFSHPEFFELPEDGILDKRYVSLVIVPKIEECLKENDMIEYSKDSFSEWVSTFLIAYKDKLFWISSAGNVTTVDHYVSLGSGERLIYPVLFFLDSTEATDEEVFDEITEGLRICATRNTGISAPFFLIDTESKEFKTVR